MNLLMHRLIRQVIATLLLLISQQGCATTVSTNSAFFISPAGSDWNDGRSSDKPWKTFGHAFDAMDGGAILYLLDGVYSEAGGTGYISYLGDQSAQPPSGSDAQHVTVIQALNPGKVRINGPLFLGRNSRKDRFIRIQGITFEGGGNLYNTEHVTIKDCGFHGYFSVGTNDHHNGNSFNLIEDTWIWGSGQRIIAINYRSHYNVWRRVLVRGDGCGKPECSGSGNPNVGITVYDSHDVSFQNVMVIDRILMPSDSPYADFAVAQHTPDERYYFGRNEWLGTISLRSPDIGYYMEPDRGATIDPTIRIENAIAWDAAMLGFNLARAGTNNSLRNITVLSHKADAVRIAPELQSGTLHNVLVAGAGRYGVNSAYVPSHVSVFNAATAAFNQKRCETNCLHNNPRADGATPSLAYLPRIESGSVLKGKGARGADIGANVVYRYGADGSRYGDKSYNEITSTPLWPWPNEQRIKHEMCAQTNRGFCSPGTRLNSKDPVTLTSYIWEYLGRPTPSTIYTHQKR